MNIQFNKNEPMGVTIVTATTFLFIGGTWIDYDFSSLAKYTDSVAVSFPFPTTPFPTPTTNDKSRRDYIIKRIKSLVSTYINFLDILMGTELKHKFTIRYFPPNDTLYISSNNSEYTMVITDYSIPYNTII